MVDFSPSFLPMILLLWSLWLFIRLDRSEKRANELHCDNLSLINALAQAERAVDFWRASSDHWQAVHDTSEPCTEDEILDSFTENLPND